ncbi:MAG: extracellular solute-binding protein [Treponema sp.]|jgi:lactose/L-arabinose transport system substrate-binding protein|nr:extracellular solute-binding protein [Treponema sp.]
MKRFGLMCLIALFTMALVLGGCSKKEEAAAPADPNAPVQLLVWCWDPNFNVFAMREAEKIYRRDHPNVSLDIQDIPEIEQKLLTALSANDTSILPDIILMQDNSIQKFVTNFPKAFLPVNGKVDISRFAQFKLDVGNVNGQNYGVPFDNGATAFFLRRDYVEQAGLQVSDFNNITWKRFVELGKIVKEKTGLPLVTGSGPDVQVQLQSTGIWTFDAEGEPYIKNNPVVREVINTYRDLMTSGVLLEVPDWNAYIASINRGTTAGVIQGCWIIGTITSATDQAGKWAMVTTPRFDTAIIPTATNYSSQGGCGWMVMGHTKKADAAFDFLDKTFAGSVELYQTILPPSGAISTWLPAAEAPVYAEPQPFFGGQKIYEELMDYASKVPQVKFGLYNYEARDAIQRAVLAVYQGGNIDAALDTAQQEVEFLMNQ